MIPPMGPDPRKATASREAGSEGDLWIRPSHHPRPAEPTRVKTQPAVLIVGAGEALLVPLTEALVRHGVSVETTTVANVSQAALAGAPDLVLLADEALLDGGVKAIGRLATSPMSSVIPVAVLTDDTGLDARLQAFRHGVAAVIRRAASVDAIATQIATLIAELPSHAERGLGDIGEVTFDELVATLAQELRTGILSIRAKAAPDQAPVRIVLGGGRPVSTIIDEFVQRMGSQVVSAEPLDYEFDERAGGTVAWLGADAERVGGATADLHGLRVLLADDDSARADLVAQELRAHGAAVAVTDLSPSPQRLARLRELDPTVLLIGERQLQGPGFALVQALREDVRLRWAALLVVPWQEVWPEETGDASLGALLGKVESLGQPERTIRRWVNDGTPFELRLEALGPARTLRTLGDSGCSLRATVHNPRALVRVDLSDGIIAGATAETLGEGTPTLQGAHALSALLMLASGRVRVEPVAQPAVTNVMAPPDVALGAAGAEPAPIAPSIPAPEPGGAAPPPKGGQRLGLPTWAWVVAGAIVVVGVVTVVAALGLAAFRRLRASPVPLATTSGATAPAPAPPSTPSSVATSTAPQGAPAASATATAVPPDPPDATAAARIAACAKLGEETHGGVGAEIPNARRALVRGDLDEAERWSCVAARRYPEEAATHVGLVKLFLLRREPAVATHFAERAVEKHPGSLELLALLGDALALAGRTEGAREALTRAAKIDAADAAQVALLERRYRAFADGALGERRYTEAERLYRRAAVLRPDAIAPTIGVARALAAQGRREDALAAAEATVKLDPKAAEAQVALGDVRLRFGDRDGARQAFERALFLDAASAAALARLRKLNAG